MQHPAKVHVDHAVPISEVPFGEWSDGGDPGVRYERVEATEPIDGERDELA
jgi:hypothetical protein